MNNSDKHYLIAVAEGVPSIVSIYPESQWAEATRRQAVLSDQARSAGKLPRELWYGVRPIDDAEGLVRQAFVRSFNESAAEYLSDGEIATVIDSLALIRDQIREEGRETPNIDLALGKINALMTPATNGVIIIAQ